MKDFLDLKVGTSSSIYACDVLRHGLVSDGALRVHQPAGWARDEHSPRHAAGSAGEVEYQVLLSQDLKVLTEPRHRDLTDRVTEVKRMHATLIQTLTADG